MRTRLNLMLRFILCFGMLLWVSPARTASSPSSPRQPNLLLICVDDLKPTLGCYGDPLARSPNVDRLAARGMRFDRAYVNQAVCAPSRNALLTGMRPTSMGIYDLGTNFRKAVPDAVTLPQYFQQHGYRSEGLGKIFHVGHGNVEDPASWSVPFWKERVVFYALPESGATNTLTREEAYFANDRRPNAALPRGAAYEAAEVPDDAYPDGKIADEAIPPPPGRPRETGNAILPRGGFREAASALLRAKKILGSLRPFGLSTCRKAVSARRRAPVCAAVRRRTAPVSRHPRAGTVG